VGPSATRRIAFGLRTADILQQAGLLPYRNQRPDPRALRLADAGLGAAHREHLLDAGELDSWSSCRVSAATFRGVDPSPGVDVDHRGLSVRDQAIKIRKVACGLRQEILGMIVED
jgi:hypothetical protein